MAERESNPFKIIRVGNAKVQAGLTELKDDLSRSPVNTYICMARTATEPTEGQDVAVLDGVLWAPERGTLVHLEEPSRHALVVGQKYEVGVSGELSSCVFLLDPETAGPLPELDDDAQVN